MSKSRTGNPGRQIRNISVATLILIIIASGIASETSHIFSMLGLYFITREVISLFPSVHQVIVIPAKSVMRLFIERPTKPDEDIETLSTSALAEEAGYVSSLLKLGSRDLMQVQRYSFRWHSGKVLWFGYLTRYLSLLMAVAIIGIYGYALFMPAGLISKIVVLLMGALILWPLVQIEKRLCRYRLLMIQRAQDAIARDIAGVIESDDKEALGSLKEYGLYLPPFVSTNKLPIGGVDIETMVAYSWRPYCGWWPWVSQGSM